MHKLEHLILKCLLRTTTSTAIVSVSGGRDSMALLTAVNRVKLNRRVVVFHYHHGRTIDTGQQEFRDRASQLVVRRCHDWGIECRVFEPADSAAAHPNSKRQSEALARDLRLAALGDLVNQEGLNINTPVFLAHHAQDLVETRIMRLLRGTGALGLKGMALSKDIAGLRLVRPWLSVQSKEIDEYCRTEGIDFVNDPSNQSLSFTRNWLRNALIPQVEQRLPGSMGRLSRSLALCVRDAQAVHYWRRLWLTQFVNQEYFGVECTAGLPKSEQRAVLHLWLKRRHEVILSESQLNELVKQLSVRKKKHGFRLAGRDWTLTQKRLTLVKARGQAGE